MQASASEGFLDPNCALLSLEDVVKDHAPSTAPSELLLDPNHNFEELASITLKFLLPLSFLDVLVDGKLDDGPCSKFYSVELTSLPAAMHGLDFTHISVHRVQNCLLK